jgi:hypothetical protein
MATATVSLSAVQPDIAYAPDFDKYQARTKRRLAREKLEKALPAGFPSKLEGDFVWDGDSVIHGTYEWVYQLKENEIVEIEVALQHFKCL